MATVSDLKIPVQSPTNSTQVAYYKADIITVSDYYPFGMEMPGRCQYSNEYRYGFNGKEKDDEIKGEGNSLDFGARMYDPRVCRWLSLDPLQAKYPNLTPFNFCANNPILYIDPDGKKIFVYVAGKAYEYKPGVKPAEGSPDVLFKVHEAASYAMQTKTGAKIWNAVGSSDKIVNIRIKDATKFDQNTDRLRPKVQDRKEGDKVVGDLDWDYDSRVKTVGGTTSIDGTGFISGYMSPSTVLLHELGHAYLMIEALDKGLNSKEWESYKKDTDKENFGVDKQYGTVDERKNIETIERPYIDEINAIEGEGGSYQRPRFNHEGEIEYNKSSPINKNPSKLEQKKEFNCPY